MRSYIKLYGPPIVKAIKALEKMAIDNPKVCISDIFIVPSQLFPFPTVIGERCNTIISKEKEMLGEYDFFFEWFKEPTMEDYEKLLSAIDETLNPLGCKYSVTTK